jgi:CheY-like chemotaxis protein
MTNFLKFCYLLMTDTLVPIRVGRERMLQSLNEEIRLCYRRAEHFAHEAKAASTETLRADYLRREQNWLKLAHSYELQHRIALFINETMKGENASDPGVGHVRSDGAAAATAWPELPAPGKTGVEPRHLASGVIAIVDDDDCVRAGLSALIESQGRRAATFASAEDFLAAEARENAVCLILDVNLPGMSGPDLQARLMAEGCRLPTVFVTGRHEDHVQKRVIASGALGYLSKPCDEKVLFDCIEKAQLKSPGRPSRERSHRPLK